MIQALHFAPNLLEDPLTKKDLSLFKALEKVYINVTLESTFTNPVSNFDKDFLSCKSCKLNEIAIAFARLLISAF